jgi:hypothetical protein
LKIPLKSCGFNAFSGDFMSGYLSMILNILKAADLPSDIFLTAGVS